MRNLIIKSMSVSVATVAMTAPAFAGGGADLGAAGTILRAISHIVAQLSSMF